MEEVYDVRVLWPVPGGVLLRAVRRGKWVFAVVPFPDRSEEILWKEAPDACRLWPEARPDVIAALMQVWH